MPTSPGAPPEHLKTNALGAKVFKLSQWAGVADLQAMAAQIMAEDANVEYAEPDRLIEELRKDTAIAEADTLLLTVPNTLGVDYNAHVIESILKHVAPALGWR